MRLRSHVSKVDLIAQLLARNLDHVALEVFSSLDGRSLLRCARVSSAWRRFLLDATSWPAGGMVLDWPPVEVPLALPPETPEHVLESLDDAAVFTLCIPCPPTRTLEQTSFILWHEGDWLLRRSCLVRNSFTTSRRWLADPASGEWLEENLDHVTHVADMTFLSRGAGVNLFLAGRRSCLVWKYSKGGHFSRLLSLKDAWGRGVDLKWIWRGTKLLLIHALDERTDDEVVDNLCCTQLNLTMLDLEEGRILWRRECKSGDGFRYSYHRYKAGMKLVQSAALGDRFCWLIALSTSKSDGFFCCRARTTALDAGSGAVATEVDAEASATAAPSKSIRARGDGPVLAFGDFVVKMWGWRGAAATDDDTATDEETNEQFGRPVCFLSHAVSGESRVFSLHTAGVNFAGFNKESYFGDRGHFHFSVMANRYLVATTNGKASFLVWDLHRAATSLLPTDAVLRPRLLRRNDHQIGACVFKAAGNAFVLKKGTHRPSLLTFNRHLALSGVAMGASSDAQVDFRRRVREKNERKRKASGDLKLACIALLAPRSKSRKRKRSWKRK